MAHYCTDVAAATVAEWQQVMRHLSTLVRPGGWLLIGVTTGATQNTFTYTGSPQIFPCVDLSDEDIYQGYLAAGYDPASLQWAKMSLPAGREYSGQTNVIGQKLS